MLAFLSDKHLLNELDVFQTGSLELQTGNQTGSQIESQVESQQLAWQGKPLLKEFVVFQFGSHFSLGLQLLKENNIVFYQDQEWTEDGLCLAIHPQEYTEVSQVGVRNLKILQGRLKLLEEPIKIYISIIESNILEFPKQVKTCLVKKL